jgi:hypothetical protein
MWWLVVGRMASNPWARREITAIIGKSEDSRRCLLTTWS